MKRQWIQRSVDRNDKKVCAGVRFWNSTKIFSFYYYFKRKWIFYFACRKSSLSGCNHEEAGTCLVLDGSKVDSDVVICEDIVVYILMIWAYSKLNITYNWYLKYDNGKSVDIRKYVLVWAKHCLWKFIENTSLNRMQYHILFLLS